ncbi:scarecrow-like protein 33 [Rhododendron vialii]|uniref:scarecrow-like protein 33 n=1 Tax=Rhododendron vialii TaxID=182163 RepID=UPI00265F5B5C|nr:scarecrow-like protein 33 [Rhododendron vialii]
MVMDPRFTEFSDSINGFKFEDDTSNLFENISNTFKFEDDSVDLNFMGLPSLPPDPNPGYVAPNSKISSDGDSPDDSDVSEDVLKYINSILMEENIEQRPSMFHDPLALQATEKSLYNVIGERYPASPIPHYLYSNQNFESRDEYTFSSSIDQSSSSNTSGGNSIDSQWICDPGESKTSVQSYPLGYPFQSGLETTSLLSFGSMKSFGDNANGPFNPSVGSNLVSSIYSDTQSILQFNRGVEEGSKFLHGSNQLCIDLENYESHLQPKEGEGASGVVVKVEKDVMASPPNSSRGRKNHHREDTSLEEERDNKQFAVYVEEEAELSEMFDEVLLFKNVKGESKWCDEEAQSEATKNLKQNGKPRAKKQGNNMEVVDLPTLLISCAQSVAADDCRTANEQLKRIRQHSTPFGDGSQRLAHIFANGLDARLAGTGSQIYQSLVSKRISAAEKLKAYQVYLKASPFKKVMILFTVKTIAHLAMKSTKKKLHIIDFGIQYGFQWPILIQFLSNLPGGVPELRITGIEFPRPGFRPAEFVEETGRRLAKYCERFNVPFQYHGIAAQKWETIKIGDLNISSDELVAVNCLFRLEHLLDETVVVDSPRDAVLKLIRKMNPDIFVHSVVNGSYSSPFFVTRFREALFHYSSLFDMFDTNLDREDEGRMNFEQEFYGREVMNIIACEGLQRFERPETYKQWQVRNMRAGFRMRPLEQELMKKLRGIVKAGYHKDFVIDENGQWMLLGWKGRIVCASSCWIPA